MNNERECYFTTDISESLSCSLNDDFDHNGLPESECPFFPCDKYKEIVKQCDDNVRKLNVIFTKEDNS